MDAESIVGIKRIGQPNWMRSQTRNLVDQRGRRIIIADNKRATIARNTRFFYCNALARIAKPALVVNINIGDNRNIGIDNIDCVETTA